MRMNAPGSLRRPPAWAGGAILFLSAWTLVQEERVDDSDYDKYVAVHVKALEAIDRSWRKDPGSALRNLGPVLQSIEAELRPRYPRLVETTIAVRLTRGIDKGEIKERHDFRPYRLAGEIALAAGRAEEAAAFLEKSPSSAQLLAEARKQIAAREKKESPPPPPPPAAKPSLDLKPFLDRKDFAAALEALRAQRASLGDEADRLSEEIRRDAVRHQQAVISVLAGLLPRLDQPDFRKDHVRPCLDSCAQVPPNLETEELRWVRRLDQWLEKRDPAEFERVAASGAAFGGDFTVLCDRAQEERLQGMERLVGDVNRAERSERPRLLDLLGQSERAFLELSSVHPRPELKERLALVKGKLPIDEKALEEARTRPTKIADIRRLADELDRLWTSERRARLSLPDQKELALDLGLYRCMALLLDGKTIPEAAQDLRLREVFRAAGELPADVSPKVAAVRARIGP